MEQKIRKYLVLSTNMQAGVMDDAVRCFGAAGLSGVVLTKLDEANGLGAALSVLIRHRLKAVWLSHGQRVPEDLKLARIIDILSFAATPPVFDDEAHSEGVAHAAA